MHRVSEYAIPAFAHPFELALLQTFYLLAPLRMQHDGHRDVFVLNSPSVSDLLAVLFVLKSEDNSREIDGLPIRVLYHVADSDVMEYGHTLLAID
jgi:hypothetical protein